MTSLYLLCTRTTHPVCFLIVPDHYWNNDPWIDAAFHLDTLSCFRAKQYLPLFLNAAFFGKVINTNFILSNSLIYPPRGDHANHYTIDSDVFKTYYFVRFKSIWIRYIHFNHVEYQTDGHNLWLTTYLLCLVYVFFNRQSTNLWLHTVRLLSPTSSFIRTRHTSYRGFSGKIKRS